MSEAEGTGGVTAYRVLARKYRPATFDDLIGQEAMVRTISNAFESGRIPQAWILSGVRGVGKTTTARILARGLNYEVPGGARAPTVRMPVLGVHCEAIMQSRHVDVLEMDAASHNGVDDIRQINDAVRYSPAYARYKVYILDEVHMLSDQAFNALLKTLEEPPPHAKFVFATTEIREVPITVLSRCQRFDLRRVDAERLVQHLTAILGREGVEAEEEALALIARAAEGSVRDSLSLLDQAIVHAAGPIRARGVREMLGLVDQARIIDLFAALMTGDIAAALAELREQYDAGADPMVVLNDLAAFTHFVTRVKIVPKVAEDRTLAETERRRGREFATNLSMPVLSRTWQMLLKGSAEVKDAARPIAAAEMVLVRIAYAAGLPPPEEVLRSLTGARRPDAPPRSDGGPAATAPATVTTLPVAVRATPAISSPPAPSPPPPVVAATRTAAAVRAAPGPTPGTPSFARFTDLIAFAGAKRDIALKIALERDVRLVRFEDGRLEIALEATAPRTLANDLGPKLEALTGRRWIVLLSAHGGEATVRSQRDASREEFRRGVQSDPVVQGVLRRFPGAEIVAVRRPETPQSEMPAMPPPAAGDDDDDPAGDDILADGIPPDDGAASFAPPEHDWDDP